MSNENMMKALFAQQRVQILQIKADHPELISDGYAYAWLVGLYPFYHDGDDSVPDSPHENFSQYFQISSGFALDVLKYLNDLWLKNKSPSFYDLEDNFGGKNVRYELLHICRYAFLENRFNNKLWDALLKPMEHPIEATSIIDPFEISELFIR